MRRTIRLLGTLAAALIIWAGCAINPNGNSGGDGRRDLAQEMPLDDWITDENGVHYGSGDRTDWRRIDVPREGTLFLEVAVDNKAATLIVGLYDKYGRELIKKTKEAGSSEHIKIEGPVTPGKYFVEVFARDTEDRSVYSLRASMEGGSAIGDIPPPE